MLFLCIALVLAVFSSCSGTASPGGSSSEDDAASSSSADNGVIEYAPPTLLYTPDQSLNPMECTDRYNSVLNELMYESLFTLDENFSPVPVLAEEYTTEDGITHQITIKSGVYFHNGTELTANDAAYSISQAMSSEKYSSRLGDIVSCEPTDAYTITIVLSKPNYMIYSLLDVPIIKNLSVEDEIPSGTGPYTYSGGTSPSMAAFAEYRDADSLPADEIILMAADSADIVSEFTSGRLSLIPSDPTGVGALEVRVDHETRYYDTTVLHYIGFNVQSDNVLLSTAEFRRAVSYAVDRAQMTDDVFDGYAVATASGIHPSVSFYDSSADEGAVYSLQSLSSILNSLGFEDSDGNTWLEYNLEEVSLRFIINSDNSRKVDAARSIVNTLRGVGVNITLSVLPWSEYLDALQTGDFDLYYAESQLTADFDMSEILLSGGALNYGGIDDGNYSELIDAYLAASTDESRSDAFTTLAQYLQSDASIIPLVFEKHSLITQRGMISGLSPTQSNVLRGFIGSTINQTYGG